MKQLSLLILVLFAFNAYFTLTIVPEQKNKFNTTYGEQFTIPRHYPKTGGFILRLFDTPKALVSFEAEILEPFQQIFNFMELKDISKVFFLNGKDAPKKNYRGVFFNDNIKISIESMQNDVTIELTLKNKEGWSSFNILQLFTNFFEAKITDLKSDRIPDIHFQKDDLMADSFSPRALIHNSKILHTASTKYHKVIIFETKVGKGLLLDGSVQYVETYTNYSGVFSNFVANEKSKDILLLGGGDLSILKSIVSSPHFEKIKKITLVEEDGELIELSKKFFQPDFEKWGVSDKIQIVAESTDSFFKHLSNETKYDAILIDKNDPNGSIKKNILKTGFYVQIQEHMSPKCSMLLQHGLLEDEVDNILSEKELKEVTLPEYSQTQKVTFFAKYTPQLMGHTLFYIFKKRKHILAKPLRTSPLDLERKEVTKNFGRYGLALSSIDEDHFPKENYFLLTANANSPITDVKTFSNNFKEIINFNNGVVKKFTFSDKPSIHGNFTLKDDTQIKFKSFGNIVNVEFKIQSKRFNAYNTIAMLASVLNTTDYFVKEFNDELATKEFYPKYQIGDLMAQENGEFAIIHNAKILEWKKTKFQKAIIYESEILGKGLILDNAMQFFENTYNYTDFFYSKIIKNKPKNILIVGGGDLIILKRIKESPEFENIEKITLVDIDGEVVELSKKYLYPENKTWIEDKKVEIIIGDANKYVLKTLPKDQKFDLVIMDTTSTRKGKYFKNQFYEKLNEFHLSQNGMVLTHAGFVSLDGEFPKDEDFPSFVKQFDHHTESIFTPEYTGHMVFYVLKKQNPFQPKDEL